MAEILRRGIDLAHQKVVYPYLTHGKAQNDREKAHERAISLMQKAQSVPLVLQIMDRVFSYNDPILKTSYAGLEAPNPLGIAAGFDKDAKFHRVLGKGFRFGRVTVGVNY